jgi:uncharacterized protein (DUF924 family)
MATSAVTNARPADVLAFWFGPEWIDGGMDEQAYAQQQMGKWFMGGAAVDAESRTFIPQIRAAGRGELRDAEWQSRDGLVAQLVLLDQLSRNAFRGEPEAYHYDSRAVEVASGLVATAGSSPASLPWPAALFVCTCLMHSEQLPMHAKVKAFAEAHVRVSKAPFLQKMLDDSQPGGLGEHTRVLERFGRYPHRNGLYGRTTTAEEAAWLASDAVPSWAKSQGAQPASK